MNRKISVLVVVVFLTFTVVAHAQSVFKSTIDDQTNVEVTVYNSNLGLVKDVRKIGLPQARGELQFMDVAAHIVPESVHIKALGPSSKFMVLEQNYEYDLMDRNKLLDKFVGKEIKLLVINQFQDRKEEVAATLLSNNGGQQIYRIKNEIYLGHPGLPILPEIPENLIAKPTLMWLYDNAGKQESVEVSYLTNNINWKADYVLVLNKDDTKGDLSGWVTIDNRSGTSFNDAVLQLVSGEINRVQQDQYLRRGMKADVMMEAAAAPQFTGKSFFEYHIYDLQRKTTLRNNQTKQINLLDAQGFDVVKEYLVYGVRTYYNYAYQEQQAKQPVNVNIKFRNSKENKLGMPLPKGIVRLYKKDDKGSLQLIGEDSIQHTPKDEEVSLKVGEAFDIVAEKKQTDFKSITTRVSESEWQITLRNRKNEDIVVDIIEPIIGNWTMVSHSHPYEKVDAFTIRYNIPIGKDEEVKVVYRVQVGF
jgi:hypothetical protein